MKRELQRNEHDLCRVVYETCVREISFLDSKPFEPYQLCKESLQATRSECDIRTMVEEFEEVVKKQEIDFETHPLLIAYPEIKNEHVYRCITMYIEYLGPLLS